MRACPSCSVISETEKGFCPECGTSYERSSATAVANPGTARTKGSPVRVLAVLGLVAYLLMWLLPQIVHDIPGWSLTLRSMSGIAIFQRLPDSLHDPFWFGPNIFSVLVGYIFLALVIASPKKSS